MKAAVLYRPGEVRVEECPEPEPGTGEVSDPYLRLRGVRDRPFVVCWRFSCHLPGYHWARILRGRCRGGAGVAGLKVGDRVTVDPNRVCHRCEYCRMGSEHLCENLSSMGVHIAGADAEYCVMPETNVYKIPDNVSFEEAAFGEPLACAVHGVDLAGIRQGDVVLVLGAGGMGNLITQLAAQAGASQVIVSEPIAFRRERALENGATHVIDPTPPGCGCRAAQNPPDRRGCRF